MIVQMNQYIKNLKTPIAIVGMARSGESAKRLLLASGLAPKDVLTFDAKVDSADFKTPQDLMTQGQPKTLLVSPGVPLASPWIQQAREQGVQITSEISLACSFLTTEKLIGVTGSLGKSTTVSLLGAGLDAYSKNHFVGGNLGVPFCEYARDLLEKKRAAADWIVLELSSYQLENCEGLSLDYSAITYLTPNHLERYPSLQDYYDTKWKIFSLTKKIMFLNKLGGELLEYAKHKDLTDLRIISKEDTLFEPFNLHAAQLIGKHNQDNLALATAIALEAGWPRQAFQGMIEFKGLSHRLENLGQVKGIRFIDDSKATAMDSVLIASQAAYETLQRGGRLFVLLGGRDKNLPWEQLKSLSALQNTQFVFFGECAALAQSKSSLPGDQHQSLKNAMDSVFKSVKATDTVLLSPGGTSFDEFKSFEDRGDFFKRTVSEFASRGS